MAPHKRPRRPAPDASYSPKPSTIPSPPSDESDDPMDVEYEHHHGGSPRKSVGFRADLEEVASSRRKSHKPASPSRPSLKSAAAPGRAFQDQIEHEQEDAHKQTKRTLKPSNTVTKASVIRFDPPLWQRLVEKDQDCLVSQEMHDLRDLIVDFGEYIAGGLRSTPSVGSNVVLENICRPEHAELVRYIGCLAMGGSGGHEAWSNLLDNDIYVEGLVCGIISRALKEHVFSALWFAGDHAVQNALERQDILNKDRDGFYRTLQRARLCRRHDYKAQTFEDNVNRVATQLEKQLSFLYHWYTLEGDGDTFLPLHAEQLHHIVDKAARLSLEMRLVGNAVYYWPPTFKDEEFEPARMEVYNLEGVMDKSPYREGKVNGRPVAILQKDRAAESEAIVRVVAFPGLVVYRKGGGDLAPKLLETERAEETENEKFLPDDVRASNRVSTDSPHNLTGAEGFRTRVLCRSAVVLDWGKQRLLTKQAGTSTHLDAIRDGREGVYEQDRAGFVELFDIFLERCPNYQVPVAEVDGHAH